MAPGVEFERSDALLDPVADPGGGAMGPLGDGSVGTNWFVLLHRRVSARAVGSPRYQWWALVALLAGLLALNITFTVFVVALPTVKADFHTNLSVLAWASTGPLLAFGVAAPFFGKAGDLFGHRRLYQFGLLGAMVSAVLTATAPDVGMLLFARALDGVQGAATGTASMAIILELFDPEDRVKALGWWSLVGAGGPVLGVTLGSPVIQYFGWRTLFWGQLVLLVVASVVVAVLLPSGRRAGPGGAAAAIEHTQGRSRSACLGGHGLGRQLEPGGVRHRRHARAEHRPHRRLDLDRRRRSAAWRPSPSPSSSCGASPPLPRPWCPPPTGAGATSCSRWAPRAFRASPTSAASSSSRSSWSRSTGTASPRSGSSRWPGHWSSPSARPSPGT